MANPEHLAKLREGREAWNAWMKEDPFPDLSGARLDNFNLSEFDLFGVDLTNASLRNASLRRTKISRCPAESSDWTRADLHDADVHGLKAPGAVFDKAIIGLTRFFRCNFRDASFRAAEFHLTTLTSSDLSETDFAEASVFMTVFADTRLTHLKGVERLRRPYGLYLDIQTFFRSGGLPESLLRAAEIPEEFITYAASLAGTAIEYYSCFLSYSSQDDEFARRLHADLQARKIKTWFAPEDLKIGDRFRLRIDESIRFHDKLILVLSRNSIDSPWVRREVEAALEREDREKKDILFPIRLDDSIFESDEPWAAELRRSRHIGDFRNWKSHDDYAVALDRLVKDLKREGPIIMR
jgi:uncharacterized protein YjbI with pentapeptide repeats